MPFRLTRQLINLMLPLKESGTLQSIMVYTLRALTNNHELLMNTMDVFIKEPSLDWQVCDTFTASLSLSHHPTSVTYSPCLTGVQAFTEALLMSLIAILV